MGDGKKHERSESTDNVLKHPSTKRAKEVDTTDNPYKEFIGRLDKPPSPSNVNTRNILHWFRSKDLRAEDNRALHAASQQAREAGGALISCFLYSPKDLQWHGTSPARSDFILNIPLLILTIEKRDQKSDKIMEFVEQHDISHVYVNIEYEVDELRRDLGLLDRVGAYGDVRLELLHDQTVVVPGILLTGSGGPHKVFTPYHKAWLSEVSGDPSLIDTTLKELFDSQKEDFPSLREHKLFPSDEDRDRIRDLWPAGHEAGMKRLHEFIDKKVGTYGRNKSTPAEHNASRLSPYFAAGVISVREALSAAWKENNNGSADFSSSGAGEGLAAWVREIVFREFYQHMMIMTPHNRMNLPQNLKFDFVEWENDEDVWKKWVDGIAGVPFVDAGMRRLRQEAYVRNRLRMNVSSYLRTNLLLDYRRGERWFAENLVDWDLCDNTQGWEPSYTVFNPISQAEKCDSHGDYIRKYVPELRDVKGKAIFDLFNRLTKEEFKKLGYPEPHVDLKESKERCLQRYKQDMADVDP
ncbi:FAD binding domain of DNA photolyase-domain-containing protein [Xylaria sp. FL1042]|nr:FAD binding domain of DNA photolyase-domain-containing protein [Xylaria sp. FL1042]